MITLKIAVIIGSLFILAGCGGQTSSTGQPTPLGQSVTYDTSPTTIVIQISRVGGNIMSGPTFTVKGDGQLTYVDSSTGRCMLGILPATQMQAILTNIIITNHFFQFKDGGFYGKVLNPDIAHQQLFVHTNAQQATISVASPSDSDSQKLNDMIEYLQKVRPPTSLSC